MDIHFTTADPRGKEVFCTVEQWFDHVLTARGWEEDEGWEDDVIETVRNPFEIRSDVDYENRQNYYSKPSHNTFYFKVVVKFESDKGEIVTAFETNILKRGEKTIWLP